MITRYESFVGNNYVMCLNFAYQVGQSDVVYCRVVTNMTSKLDLKIHTLIVYMVFIYYKIDDMRQIAREGEAQPIIYLVCIIC